MFFLEEPRYEPELLPKTQGAIAIPQEPSLQSILDSGQTLIQGFPKKSLACLIKLGLCLQLMFRKIYVWKILSVRKKWYANRDGGLYNPKLKATIYPTWVCTWNISRFDGHYDGIDTKETAQAIAFKLWMKKRRLKNKLGISEIQMSVPIAIGQKILPNKIYIRKASPKDALDILGLMESLGYPLDDNMKTRIEAYAYGTNNHIFLAEKGKKVVGFIAFVIYDLFVSEGKRCHIEEFVVDKGVSDLSIKRKLMQAVEDFARDQNGKIIDLTIGSHRVDDVSNDFYKFMGYDNNSLTAKTYMKKEL
jgi:GNAT superfamily N-acetyltransferase